MRRLLWPGMALLVALQPREVPAQGPAAEGRPAPAVLESVSIKPNQSGEPGGSFGPNQGRFSATNLTPRNLISWAYRIRNFQLEGLPDWADRERYDVLARTSTRAIAGPAMLIPVLAARFGLEVRRETRPMPIYALVKARPDGRLGPGLVPTANPCNRERTDWPPCRMRFGPDLIEAIGMDFGMLPEQIIGTADRMVVDRTGLEGRFDVSLKWTPDLAAGEPPTGEARVSLFTALQEQLGLRLQPDTGPVEVLIVERISRPTPD